MENYTFDLQRIFFGDLPLLFLFEILLRTTILYLFTVFLMRLAPRRNIGQMTPLEMLVIIALGSSVGDPMFYPQVPLIHGMAVISLVLGLQTFLVYLSRARGKWENWIDGNAIRIVQDGQLDLAGMAKAKITREDVFMGLRMTQHTHLGEIEEAYVEKNGQITVHTYASHKQRNGFIFMPPVEEKDWNEYHAGESVPASDFYVCKVCGKTEHYDRHAIFEACPRCQHKAWLDSVGIPIHSHPPGNET